MNEIGKELNLTVSYTNEPSFSAVIPAVANNNNDCAISAITITASELQVVDFSDSYSGPSDQYGIAINKANPGLKAAINEALAKIIADGRYQTIYNKWFT